MDFSSKENLKKNDLLKIQLTSDLLSETPFGIKDPKNPFGKNPKHRHKKKNQKNTRHC